MSTAELTHVDESRLESDLGYRFDYLAGFVEFTPDDIDVIHGMAGHLAPLVEGLVDAVYVKLFQYDATKRHFTGRQEGFAGQLPEGIAALGLDDEIIRFRKGHLARYLVRLVTAAYDAKLVNYLDFVGKMHTPKAGAKEVDVPLVQMNALMGYVSDALLATILSLDISDDLKNRAARAFNKLLWLQNDLINRHYAA